MKRNKVIALMLGLVLMIFAGCTDSEGELKQPAEVNTDVVHESVTTEPDSDPEVESDVEVSIDETLLYEANGVKVTATGYEEGWSGPEIKLLIENGSDKNVLITAEAISVNGYMMPMAGLYEEVAAGKKANSCLSLWSSDLEEAGITTIADIQFILEILNGDTWDFLARSNLLSVSTSAVGYEQPVDDSGDVICDSKGIKVVCKGLKQDWLWDGALVFYIENNTGEPVTVCAENVSVNGFMEDAGLWADLREGTRLIDGMYLLDLSDLELESVDDVENIEFNLRVINSDTWDEILTTDAIALNFD